MAQNPSALCKIRRDSVIFFYQFVDPKNTFRFSLLLVSSPLLNNQLLMRTFLSNNSLMLQLLWLLWLYNLIHLLWWGRKFWWPHLILWGLPFQLVSLKMQRWHLLLKRLLILLLQWILPKKLHLLLHFSWHSLVYWWYVDKVPNKRKTIYQGIVNYNAAGKQIGPGSDPSKSILWLEFFIHVIPTFHITLIWRITRKYLGIMVRKG